MKKFTALLMVALMMVSVSVNAETYYRCFDDNTYYAVLENNVLTLSVDTYDFVNGIESTIISEKTMTKDTWTINGQPFYYNKNASGNYTIVFDPLNDTQVDINWGYDYLEECDSVFPGFYEMVTASGVWTLLY